MHPDQDKDQLNQSVESLNYLLKSCGAKVQVNIDKEYGTASLFILCKSEDYSKKAKRHAGRPEIFNEKMTVGEAINLKETHTMDEIAEMAGFSLRTLQRRLKEAKGKSYMLDSYL